MLSKEITIKVDLGKYRHVTLSADEATKLLNKVCEITGKRTSDVDEVLRYISNFDVFYEVMRKKFKDALAPPRTVDDMIRGNVVIDKVRLFKEDDEKKVTIIFDRRVPLDIIEKALRDLGYEVKVEREVMY